MITHNRSNSTIIRNCRSGKQNCCRTISQTGICIYSCIARNVRNFMIGNHNILRACICISMNICRSPGDSCCSDWKSRRRMITQNRSNSAIVICSRSRKQNCCRTISRICICVYSWITADVWKVNIINDCIKRNISCATTIC